MKIKSSKVLKLLRTFNIITNGIWFGGTVFIGVLRLYDRALIRTKTGIYDTYISYKSMKSAAKTHFQISVWL